MPRLRHAARAVPGKQWRSLPAAVVLLASLGSACGSGRCGVSPFAPVLGREDYEKGMAALAVDDGTNDAKSSRHDNLVYPTMFLRQFTTLRERFFSRAPLTSRRHLAYFYFTADSVSVLLKVPDLDQQDDDGRKQLLELAWTAMEFMGANKGLAFAKKMSVGLVGAESVGAFARGFRGGQPEMEVGSPVPVEKVYPWFLGGGGIVEGVRPEPPATKGATPIVTGFTPARAKGPWSWATWRARHQFCKEFKEERLEAPGHHLRAAWMETCEGRATVPLVVRIEGNGFSLPAGGNTVFFGDQRAQVLWGDATRLFVVPEDAARTADVTVVTTPVDRLHAGLANQASAPRPFVFVGPPQKVLVEAGDAQVVAMGEAGTPMKVSILDADGNPVDGERVWFWARKTRYGSWPGKPVRFATAVTDVVGRAEATFTAPNVAGAITLLAEPINVIASRRDAPEVHAELTVSVPPDPADLQRLVGALETGEVEARREAARSLGGLGPAGRGAIPALIVATREPELRSAAVGALVDIRAVNEVLPLLRTLVQVNEDCVWAGDALQQLGREAAPAVPELMRVLLRPATPYNYACRYKAVETLARVADEASLLPHVTHILTLLSEPEAEVRKFAAQLLGRLGRRHAAQAERPLQVLAETDPRTDVRQAATNALAYFGPTVEDPARKLVAEAVVQLAPGGSAEVVARLVNRDGSPAPNERVGFRAQGPFTVATESVLTNEAGEARVRITAHAAPGEGQLEARHDFQTAVTLVVVRP